MGVAVILRIASCLLLLASAAGCAQAPRRGAETPVRPPDRAGLVERVSFPTAGATPAPRDAAAVTKNARWMGENRAAVVVLRGHCDERGSSEYNMELGDRRARSVMGMLMREGVHPSRLIVVSRGESEPIDPGHGPTAWEKNRRVEFVVR